MSLVKKSCRCVEKFARYLLVDGELANHLGIGLPNPQLFVGSLRQIQLMVEAAIICRAGIYPDSRQEERILYVVTIGSYMHHVFACEIVAALLEKLDYGLRKSIAVSCKSVI